MHEAAAAPAAPATPAAHRPKPGHSEAAKGLAPAAKPGHSEPGKGLAPAAEPPQQGEAVPAAESSDRADSDSDISIGMWDLPPGPPREGLPHVAVKLEEDERVADTEMKLETTTCANPPQVRLRLFSLPNDHSPSTDHVCVGSLLTAIYSHTFKRITTSMSAYLR